MNLYTIILGLHIASGTVALISGLFAILFKKGRGNHTTAGKIYYLSMYAIGISSVTMCLMKFNMFLLCIGIFSTYLTYSGKKAIFYWRLKEDHIPSLKERLPLHVALVTAIAMVCFAAYMIMWQKNMLGIPLLVFGTILLINVLLDIKMFRNADNFRPRNSKWLIKHIGTMGGAYIATVTAFVVVNVKVHLLPGWVLWLAPTVIGSVLITRVSVKWTKKLNKGGKAKPAMAS